MSFTLLCFEVVLLQSVKNMLLILHVFLSGFRATLLLIPPQLFSDDIIEVPVLVEGAVKPSHINLLTYYITINILRIRSGYWSHIQQQMVHVRLVHTILYMVWVATDCSIMMTVFVWYHYYMYFDVYATSKRVQSNVQASREEYKSATVNEQRSYSRKENAALWICVHAAAMWMSHIEVWDRAGKCSSQMFCRTLTMTSLKQCPGVHLSVWYNRWNQHCHWGLHGVNIPIRLLWIHPR